MDEDTTIPAAETPPPETAEPASRGPYTKYASRRVGVGRYPYKVKARPPKPRAGRPPREKVMPESVVEAAPVETPPVASDAPFTETQAFKDAVTKAAAEAVAKLMADARSNAGTTDDGGDKGWMRALAMEISQLTDQGTGRKRVAPEIIRQRQQSHDRMIELLIEARAQKKIATYKVRAKTLLYDRVVEPFWIASDHTAQPTIIDYDNVPNEALVPENATAKAIYEAYRGWLGSVERPVPEDDLAITPGGLVVHGGAASISAGKRRVGSEEAKQTGDDTGGEGGLNIHHKNEPGRFVEKRILGSIAAPARQTV